MAENISYDDLRKTDRYDIACCSGIGKRDSQQDCAYFFADDHSVYAVLCDGMGGLGGGELASKTAVKIASERYHLRYDTRGSQAENKLDNCWMMDTVVAADRAVYDLKDVSDKRIGAGSTLVSVWLQENQLFWVSAGDSRVYLFHGQEAVQATTDLNYFHRLDQCRQDGSISDTDYQREAVSGEALISFLGLGNLEMIDRNTEPLQLSPGDTVLLCSDGLYRTIDAAWMSDILTACDTMDEVANFIHMIINEHGSEEQDNYTCILIRINE